ncbi:MULTISPECIES: glycosyltransferase family 39 protein [unclassified Cryobacterium]|uniref:glycosyltransferase family 39 protein n=1 Tax=unclassified Cryobacterium TaxID=2649013 RepID=UPI001068FEFB|nr:MULTISPECIES: glycosyltransferase family 39 protein [unclassified Cryobacterium]TFD04103.1 hypothetical protein E3T29_15730 [Cryobacterium sp. TMT1-66-1]TFD10552.1 hypothetical protein E3T35_12495 [Cryobacterium sp. TMT1-2-2]
MRAILEPFQIVDASDQRYRGRRSAGLLGVFAVSVSLLASGVPSYWSDEVATLRAARLSWAELFAFLGQKDAVHTGYYSVMKVWVGAFGESEFSTRSLSALAVGAAAAGIVLLVASVGSLRVGVVAGVLFAILPRTTYMGIEARSFALSVAVAVWATLILLVAARRPSWRWWTLYALAVVTGTYLFLYSVLLLAVHAVVLLLDHRTRRVLSRWAVAALVVVVACVPLLVVSVGQKEQIAWLSDQPVVNVWTILVEPAFDSSWLVAAIAWVTILVLAVRGRRVLASRDGGLLRLAAVWVVLPLLLLLVADALIGPLYTARYLSFTVPGMAVVLAVAFTRTPRTVVTWILVGAVALAGLPTYLAQRGPVGKNGGSDLAQIADYIDSQALPGDAIYLQDTGSVTLRPRQALYAYPDHFAHVQDIAFIAPFTTTGTFSDVTVAWPDIRSHLADVDRIWVVQAGTSMVDTNNLLLPLGYVKQQPHETNRSVIALYELPPISDGDG